MAKDRVISVIDPEANPDTGTTPSKEIRRLQGRIAIDPDSEIITATAVTPGNAGDGSVAEDLIADLLEHPDDPGDEAATAIDSEVDTSPAPPSD